MNRTFTTAMILLIGMLSFAGCDSAPKGDTTGGNNVPGSETSGSEKTEMTSATEADILKILEDLRAAVEKGDPEALDKIYANDYMIVSQTGTLETKQQRLDSMKTGDVKYESVEFIDPKVRLYGDAAVVVAKTVGKGTMKGEPLNVDAFATIVFAKTSDGWREVSAQLTNTPPAEKKQE